MALATKCPHCNTTFRVASDQLKLRGGIVRCGFCDEVFDGNATLVDSATSVAPVIEFCPDTSETVALPVPEQEVDRVALAQPAAEKVAPDDACAETAPPAATKTAAAVLAAGGESDDDAPDGRDDDACRFGTLPLDGAQQAAGAMAVGPEAEYLELALDAALPSKLGSGAKAIPQLGADVCEPDSGTAVFDQSDQDSAAPFAALPERTLPLSAADNHVVPVKRSRVHGEEPIVAVEAKIDEPDEPKFVTQSRRRLRSGKTMRALMSIGSALLLVALLTQGLTTFRNQLAAQVPALKPLLVSICSRLGCHVDLPARIELISIEQGELQTLSENTFSYATVLHNKSNSAQAWPDIELVLNDNGDQPLLRRVFTPREYLSAPPNPNEGFAGHSEQAVKLYFELARLKASGYHIAVFYP